LGVWLIILHAHPLLHAETIQVTKFYSALADFIQNCKVPTNISYVKFKVLTAASMKFRVFWDVAPCSHVEVRRVSEVHTASIIALMMEAVRTSETSVKLQISVKS
jgi:hypothetical protein